METAAESPRRPFALMREVGLFPPRSAVDPGYANGMDQRMTALERAFQLARSGRVAALTDIITSLKRDGYSASQIEGPLLKRQLADLIKATRANATSFDLRKQAAAGRGLRFPEQQDQLPADAAARQKWGDLGRSHDTNHLACSEPQHRDNRSP
jgi:hypothetical protein